MTSDLELDDNPTARSIEKLIGIDLMTQLSCDLGGRRLFIAANPGENSPLAVSVGLDAAQKISDIYAGATFDVPLGLGVKAEILKLHASGMPIVRISATTKRSIRQVRRIVNAVDESKQLHLL